MEWRGLCEICHCLIIAGAGVFCGNFSSARGPWKECQKAWCGKCYTPLDDNEFPIAKPVDEDGVDVSGIEDANRFLYARNGDNLVTPFQCDLCHFRNLMDRDPVPGLPQDVRLQKLIRRANLDALWAREPSTVNKTLLLCRQGHGIAASLGFGGKLFRPMGPFPLEDMFGMGAAVVMLQMSLKQGKYAKHLQFGTVRKFRSAFSNVFHASLEGQQAAVMARDTKKMFVTKCPTYGEFFERFVRGLHKRMGEIVRPDRAISIEVMKELCNQLDLEWDEGYRSKFDLATEAAFYLIAFCGALRGEEVPKVDLYGAVKHWEEGEIGELKHVVVPLTGRFKGETGENYHLLCFVDVTSHGLEPRKWIGRLIQLYLERGIRNGAMFRNATGERMHSTYLETRWLERLETIQDEKPHLMPGVEDVFEEYGISRSFRRGATSEVVNQGVHPDVINANNRWRKAEQAGASQPSLQIREHYTDVRMTLKQRLQFSRAL